MAPGMPIRVGSISFLNTRPLVWGLDHWPDLHIEQDVPSRLAQGLSEGRYDVALLPVIDCQRIEGARLLTVAGIGSEDATLTVRIFSTRPIDQIRSMACDTDSHTSVALARVVLAEKYGLRPDFVERSAASGQCSDAVLLIGDKVVCEEPAGMPHQLDLGRAWRQLTGLPFLFAAWTARADVDLGDLPRRLALAKHQGLENVQQIVQRYAVPRGWPAELARQYLTVYMNYDIGPRQLQALERFYALAHKHGVLGQPPRPLELYCREV